MTSTGFGWIKYNDKIYEHDVLILADGRVLKRNEDELRRKYGTSHAIGADEIRFIMKEQPKVIVIGTGQSCLARLTQEAKEIILKSPVRLIEGPSPAACKRFDSIAEKKAAIIHVTC